MSDYAQVITTIGLGKIMAALAGGAKVDITEVAVGDADTLPTVGLTALGDEVWRGAVNAVDQVPGNPDQVLVEASIPTDEAVGYTLREAGAFDAAGDMILIARIPDSIKPDPATDGAAVVAYVKLTVAIANAANALTLTVDDSVIMATRLYVEDAVEVVSDRVDDHEDGGLHKHDASEVDDETPGGYHGATAQLSLDALSTGLAAHEDGTAHKHDASEIDDETIGGYHGVSVRATLDALSFGLTAHQNGGPGKHDATEIDFDGGGFAAATVEAVLKEIRSILPIACGIFRLGDAAGGTQMIGGQGFDAGTPITRVAAGSYDIFLAGDPPGGVWADIAVQLTPGGHSVGFETSGCCEHIPERDLAGASNIRVYYFDQAGAFLDPPANDSNSARIQITVWDSRKMASLPVEP